MLRSHTSQRDKDRKRQSQSGEIRKSRSPASIRVHYLPFPSMNNEGRQSQHRSRGPIGTEIGPKRKGCPPLLPSFPENQRVRTFTADTSATGKPLPRHPTRDLASRSDSNPVSLLSKNLPCTGCSWLAEEYTNLFTLAPGRPTGRRDYSRQCQRPGGRSRPEWVMCGRSVAIVWRKSKPSRRKGL